MTYCMFHRLNCEIDKERTTIKKVERGNALFYIYIFIYLYIPKNPHSLHVQQHEMILSQIHHVEENRRVEGCVGRGKWVIVGNGYFFSLTTPPPPPQPPPRAPQPPFISMCFLSKNLRLPSSCQPHVNNSAIFFSHHDAKNKKKQYKS